MSNRGRFSGSRKDSLGLKWNFHHGRNRVSLGGEYERGGGCSVSENWLQERLAHGEVLRAYARGRWSKMATAIWDRYARKTARMQAVDEQLRRGLPSSYRVMSGERLLFRGVEMELEHLVIGPAGILLIEVAEGPDAAWQQDLERNIAFFRESLGVHAGLVQSLVVQRGVVDLPLPTGAHFVPDVEVAMAVIREQEGEGGLTGTLANEVVHLVRGMRVRKPQAIPVLPWLHRLGWDVALRLETLSYLLILSTMVIMGRFGEYGLTGLIGAFLGFIFGGIPSLIFLYLIGRIRDWEIRRHWHYLLLLLQGLMLWLAFYIS